MHRHTAILLLLAPLLLAPLLGQAQPTERCFFETPYCISGQIRTFWEQNGGVPVFGYPISPADLRIDPATGSTSFIQWFERHRLELFPNNTPPYNIQLGHLGAERLDQLGTDWQRLPRADGPQPDCLWFEATGHNLCDQLPGVGFKSYWERFGLSDPALTSYEQSLALFGMPLSEPRTELLSTGERVEVQWFERARLEFRPNNPPPYTVQAGLLGREVYAQLAPIVPPTPPPPARDGLWQGQTRQFEQLLLDIEGGTLQTVVSDVQVRGEDYCTRTVLYIKSAFAPGGLGPVGSDGFAITIEDAEHIFTIEGTFESATIASGQLHLTTKETERTTCNGSATTTWRAALQVPTPTAAPPPPPGPFPTFPPLPDLPDTSTEPSPTPTSAP